MICAAAARLVTRRMNLTGVPDAVNGAIA